MIQSPTKNNDPLSVQCLFFQIESSYSTSLSRIMIIGNDHFQTIIIIPEVNEIKFGGVEKKFATSSELEATDLAPSATFNPPSSSSLSLLIYVPIYIYYLYLFSLPINTTYILYKYLCLSTYILYMYLYLMYLFYMYLCMRTYILCTYMYIHGIFNYRVCISVYLCLISLSVCLCLCFSVCFLSM